MADTAAATSFMALPNLGPRARKSGFIFFTSIPAVPSIYSTSFTFTSVRMRSRTASNFLRKDGSITGTIIFARGCLTFMFTFLRNARIIEDTLWAMSILSSRSLSIRAESHVGNSSRCTDTWFTVPGFRFPVSGDSASAAPERVGVVSLPAPGTRYPVPDT